MDHIRSGGSSNIQSTDDTPEIPEPIPIQSQSEILSEAMSPPSGDSLETASTAEPPQLRVSSRVRKPPAHLSDYVVFK